MPDENPDKRPAGFVRQFAMATELPFVFVGALVVGGFLGHLLDRWWHTAPWLMIAGGALGFAVGLRDLLRRLSTNDDN
jgi:F0F1-type ATP synthase assembly protein I